MRLPKRDLIATTLVGAAVVLYFLWAVESTLPGLSGIRATGLAILALGFAASASAVVPGFDQLLHGNKLYLAATSILGLAALLAGIQMLVASSDAALGALVVTMVVLWLITTAHHALLAQGPAHSRGAHHSTGPHPGVT